MKNAIRNYSLSAAAALCLTGNASAAWTFANASGADMMLGFRANAGTGFQKDLFFNLGSSIAIRDGVPSSFGLRGNINDDLVDTFGANWASRTDLTFGVIANRTADTGTVAADFTPGQPDPNRIAYISRGTSVPGGAAAHDPISGNALAAALNGVTTLEGILNGLTETSFADGAARRDRLQPTDLNYDQTSWSTRVPFSGLSFGGLQNIGTAFGPGNVAYADIQRLGGSTTVIPYTNTTVATIAIDDLGNISVIPEPSTLALTGLAALALLIRRRR